MKKIFCKIAFIIIIFLVCITNISLASSNNFRISLQSDKTVNAGDIVEIPIILDNITFSSIQKGIISFSCNINIDETVLELIPYSEDSYIKISDTIIDYTGYYYLPTTKKFVFRLDTSYFTEIGDYINNYIEVGTIKVKAKDNATTGTYNLSVTNIQGGNDEITINVPNTINELYINGKQSTGVLNEQEKVIGSTVNLTAQNKELIYNVKQNEDGSKIIITVDLTNGIELGKIICNETEMTSTNGVYQIDTVPGVTNLISFYDKENNFLGITYFQTAIESEIGQIQTSIENSGTSNTPSSNSETQNQISINETQNIINETNNSIEDDENLGKSKNKFVDSIISKLNLQDATTTEKNTKLILLGCIPVICVIIFIIVLLIVMKHKKNKNNMEKAKQENEEKDEEKKEKIEN